MATKKYKLEIVQWYDAEADCSWAQEEDIDQWMKEEFLALEVGWVIRENKDIIILTSSIGTDGTIGNRTKVPKPWIKSRKSISLGDEYAKTKLAGNKRSKAYDKRSKKSS